MTHSPFAHLRRSRFLTGSAAAAIALAAAPAFAQSTDESATVRLEPTAPHLPSIGNPGGIVTSGLRSAPVSSFRAAGLTPRTQAPFVKLGAASLSVSSDEIVNDKAVQGDILTGDADDVFFEKVEGSVSGKVDLGLGDDTFWLEQRADTLASLPLGGVDGGEGFDRFGIRLTQSGTIDPASLPTNFERFAIDLCGCDIVATIAEGTIAGGLDVTGAGSVTNLATITYQGSDTALTVRGDSEDTGLGLDFVNKGRIEAVGTDAQVLVDAGYDSYHFGSFVNEGTIALSGSYGTGVGVSTYDLGGEEGFINRGEITGSGADSVTLALQGSGRNEGAIGATGEGSTGALLGYYTQLTNTADATIAGTDRGVVMQGGGRLENAGTIEGGTSAVNAGTSSFLSPTTVINRAGGTIRGTGGTAITAFGEGSVALANQGTVVGNVNLAQGKDTVWLAEGGRIEGDLSLGGGDDALMVAIDRFSGAGVLDISGLLTGALDTGSGNDTLWLRADASGTRNVFNGAVSGFEAGLVYEAAGEGTELILQGPLNGGGAEQSYEGLLRVAGDGRMVVDIDFANSDTSAPSIFVEPTTSAGLFGDLAGDLDLVLASTINGGSGGAVDATNAGRVELRENAGRIAFTGGTGLKAGGDEVLIGAGAEIRKTGEASGTLLASDYADVVNRGTLIEEAKTATADNISAGLRMTGGLLRNEGAGRIDVLGTGVEITVGGEVRNDGQIVSHYGNAIEATGFGTSRIINGAQGAISGHTEGNLDGIAGAAIVAGFGSERVENAGTINGHVVLAGGDDIYVATGGTLNGDLNLGAGDDMLLARDGAALNVTGTIEPGTGIDAFGNSFSQSGSFDLGGNVLPTGFEMHGVEASGDATVTLTSAETQTRGVRAIGSGSVRNEANITLPADESGGYAAIEVRDPEGASALKLVNAGKIVSGLNGVTAYEGLGSFTNTGQIEAQQEGVAIYAGNQLEALGFDNSGSITSASGAAALISVESFDEEGTSANIVNSGSLSQTGEGGAGLRVFNGGGVANVSNSGTITASGDDGFGARLASEGVLKVGNSGTIAASGLAGTALSLSDEGFDLGSVPDCTDVEFLPQVTASLVNTGTIRASGNGASGEGYVDLSTGLLAVAGRDNGIISVENRAGGTIEATGASSVAVLVMGEGDDGYGETLVDKALHGFEAADWDGYGGGDVDPELRFFELDNAGTIRGGADVTLGEDTNAYAGEGNLANLEPTAAGSVIAGAIQTIDTTDHIVNLAGGTIIGNVSLGNGNDVFESFGSLQGNLDLGSGDDKLVYGITSSFTGVAQGGAGSDTLVVDLNGEGSVNFDQFRGFESLGQQGSGTIAIRGTTDMSTLNIGGSNVSVLAGATFDAAGDTVLTGGDGAEQLTVGGTVAGSVALGKGNDRVTLQQGGLVDGLIDLGEGDDFFDYQGGTANGVIDGGAGTDTVGFQIAGTVTGLPDVINFESLDVSGEGLLSIVPTQDFNTITLRNGADLTVTGGEAITTIGAIVGDDSNNAVTLRTPLTGSVSLGGGNDLLDIELQGTLSGALDGGAGTDTLALQLIGPARIDGGIQNFENINVNGTPPLTLGATLAAGQTMTFDGGNNTLIVDGGSILGIADGGAGSDTIAFDTDAGKFTSVGGKNVRNFENLSGLGQGTLVIDSSATFQSVQIEGNLAIDEGVALTSGSTTMSAGNNVLTLEGGASIVGPVDGGAGRDRLVLFQNAQQVRKLSSVDARGFEEMESGGPGELVIDRNAGFDVVDLLGATMTVNAGSTLTVPTLAGGDGANTLNVFGTVAGGVNLGAGDDRLTLGALTAVTGARSGGAGTDTLDLRVGSATQAATWNGTGFDSFERLEVSGGSLRLNGSANYQRVTVSGGSFVGEAGSTITSDETIVVGQGATFGSAGAVRGNIEVRGTLAPGASPGTMSVTGDVSFLSGSRLALEVAPSAHDLLDISGKLTIASGTTMDITGALGSSPINGAIDLAVANGGITGGFTTINKSESIFGYVATRGNKIQILGEFQNSGSYPTNVQAAIDYSNDLLQAGQMVQAYTGILPILTDNTGAVRPAGFARLTPEVYATGTQASLDTGLAITDAVRMVQLSAPEAPGWFGFAQGLAQWSKLGNDEPSGAYSAKSDTQGVLGGIGYTTSNGSRFGAYIGGVQSTQKVRGLDAETESDGVVLGAFADMKLGQFAAHAAIAYDMSKAETTRSVVAGQPIKSKYDLGGFIADAAVSYDFAAGDWSVRPQVGVTYIAGRREGVTEQGSTFALDVDGRKANAWFGDASLTVGRTKGAVRPYVEAGLRYRLDGSGETASGRFVGVAEGDGMVVDGADADRTKVRLGAGVVAQVADNVRLNVGYRAEFGDQARHNVTGGLTVSF